MIDMKLLVKELCKKRGLTLSQLADKMGVSLSNLSASLNGNPTLERLEDIAKNLGVDVYDLFQKPSETSGILGLVDINGETFKITTAEEWLAVSAKVPGLLNIPTYNKDSDLIKDLRDFIKTGIKKQDRASLFGRFGTAEIFILSRAPHEEYDNVSDEYGTDMIFTLTLVSRGYTQTYSLIEYGNGGDYDIDGNCGMVMTIRNEIEANMDSCNSCTEEYGE